MSDGLSDGDVNIWIDDGARRERRPAKCRVVQSNDPFTITLSYERRDGSGASIEMQKAMLTPHMGNDSGPPPLMTLYFVGCTDGTKKVYGPFTRRETAVRAAVGRGEHGTDGSVAASKFVVWTDPQHGLRGYEVKDSVVQISEALPEQAEIDMILSDLPPKQRIVMEKALGRR